MEVIPLLLFISTLLLVKVVYCTARTCDHTCRISKAHRMLMADCYHQELKEFPCIRSDVEVIDVSLNRLRRLEEDDLREFSSLRILYLMENMIMRIDDHAFVGQNDLEVLDLTMNSFSTLPSAIFELPSLRRLILGHNENANIVEILENVERIASPLEYIDLSYNRMERLPVLPILPTLLSYNISGNENLEMSTSNFAGVCNLVELLNDNVTYRFNDPCECWILTYWFLKRSVRFEDFHCDAFAEDEKCSNKGIPTGDLEEFDSCKQTHSEMLQKVKLMNIVLPIVAGVIILFLIIILILVLRWRRRSKSALTWEDQHDESKDSLNKHSL